MTDSQRCPFDECDWSTSSAMTDDEVAAVEGGWDRLALHLFVEHDATREPDRDAWYALPGRGEW